PTRARWRTFRCHAIVSEPRIQPRTQGQDLLRPLKVVLPGPDAGSAVVPLPGVPGSDAPPDVARGVADRSRVVVISQPPGPAFIAPSQPAAEHVDARSGGVPVPGEDPRPRRRLRTDDAERHGARRAVAGRAEHLFANLVTPVRLLPVRLEVRDGA